MYYTSIVFSVYEGHKAVALINSDLLKIYILCKDFFGSFPTKEKHKERKTFEILNKYLTIEFSLNSYSI